MFDFTNAKTKKKIIAVVAILLIISMIVPTILAVL